ncbi:retrovirus-related Pol polyprotein from transposon TNT 1-94, partial [Trifolium pratense]
MAGKNNFHANLPILDGKNWDTWVKQMKVIFNVQEVDEQVNTVFDKIADFTTSKEAWDTLQKSYDGDEKVKKVILHALKREYELLEMKNDETIADYFTRVVTLTNQMKNCGSNLAE